MRNYTIENSLVKLLIKEDSIEDLRNSRDALLMLACYLIIHIEKNHPNEKKYIQDYQNKSASEFSCKQITNLLKRLKNATKK